MLDPGLLPYAQEAAVALLQSGEVPTDGTTPTNVTLPGVRFSDPVVVDLHTGVVYDVPEAGRQEGSAYEITGLPLGDSPLLVAEASAVPTRRP